jgi:hypothetical protein
VVAESVGDGECVQTGTGERCGLKELVLSALHGEAFAHQAKEYGHVRPSELANDSFLAVEAQSEDDHCHSGEGPNSREDSAPHARATVLSMHVEVCAMRILVGYAEGCVEVEDVM